MKPQAVAVLTGCLFGLVGATVELWPPQDAIGPALEGIVDLVCWPAYALLEFYGRFFHGNVEAAMPLVVPVVYLYWSVPGSLSGLTVSFTIQKMRTLVKHGHGSRE